MVKTERTIIVLGVPRSGTSMMAGILRCLGVMMGENIKPDKHEDLDFLFKDNMHRIKTTALRNQLYTQWGWKDPWIGSYLHFLLPYLCNPVYVRITRNEKDAIKSDMKRNKNVTKKSATMRNKKLTAGIMNYDAIDFTYEEVIKSPRKEIRRLVKELKLNVPKELVNATVKFVKPGGYSSL